MASKTSVFLVQHASHSASARRSAGSSKFALSGYECTMVRYTGSSSGSGSIATCLGISRQRRYITLQHKGGWEEQSKARRKGGGSGSAQVKWLGSPRKGDPGEAVGEGYIGGRDFILATKVRTKLWLRE